MRKIGYIELQTLILEIECILNNRPLCPDYDSEVDDVLTPNHLVYGRRLENVNFERNADVNLNEYSIELNKREKRLSILINHFWKIWRKEYLILLRQFQKRTALAKEPKVKMNDIVLIYCEKLPRQLWKLGVIISLIVGPDDIIRGAKVKVAKTGIVITRPLNKLYPIEINRGTNDSNNDNQSCDVTNSTDSRNSDTFENPEFSINNSDNVNNERETLCINARPRREAAVHADLKRKYLGD